MALSLKELKAAKSIASGASDIEAIGASCIGKTTFYKLKKTKGFKDAVQWFVQERIAVTENANPVSIEQSAEREKSLNEKLDKLAHSLTDAAQRMAEHLNELEAKEISLRLLPGLITAIKNVVETKRQGEDRLNGIEGLLDDLASIEATIAQKVVSIDRGRKDAPA